MRRAEVATMSGLWEVFVLVFWYEGVVFPGGLYNGWPGRQDCLIFASHLSLCSGCSRCRKRYANLAFSRRPPAWVPSDERVCQFVPSLTGKQTGRIGGNEDG